MGINASKAGGSSFKRDTLEAGVYPGRLVQIIDLGLQEQAPFQGKPKDPVQEINLTYELADEFMKDDEGEDIEDKPRWISEKMPLHNINADRAKSTQRYNAMDPEHIHEGDFSKLLGTPVNITIVVNEGKGKNAGKFYENVAGLAPMREKEAKKLPALVNETKVFDLDDPDMDVFNSLPDWLQKKIKSNLNYAGSPLEILSKGVPQDKAEEEEERDEDERPY